MHRSFREGFEKRAQAGMCHCPHCGNPVVLTAPVVLDPDMGAQVPEELQALTDESQEGSPQSHMLPPLAEGPGAPQAEANPQTQAGRSGLPSNNAPDGQPPPPGMGQGIPTDRPTLQGDRPPNAPLGNLKKKSARDYGEQFAGSQFPYGAQY